MADRGLRQATGTEEWLAYDQTVAGQRALLEAMPFAISVVSEAGQQVPPSNHGGLTSPFLIAYRTSSAVLCTRILCIRLLRCTEMV